MAHPRKTTRRKAVRTNPYFREEAHPHIVRKVLTITASISVLAGFVYLFVFSSWLRFGDVIVNGGSDEANLVVKNYTTDYITKHIALVIPRNHKFLLSTKNLNNNLMETFPLNFANIYKEKDLIIEISEKISTFYLLHNDIMYAIDRTGSVLGKVDDLDRVTIESTMKNENAVPMIYDNRSGAINEGDSTLSEEWLENIVTLFDQVEARTMLTPKNAILSDDEGRVDITTDAGVTLYFTLKRPTDMQINKLETLIDRKLVEMQNISYIDLRFKNRLFYH